MKLISGILISLVCFLLPFPALGESMPADTVVLQEVTVSAVKSSASAFDEPVAYTSLGRQEVDNLGIVTVKGISDIVPNFFVPDYGSRITSSIYVRGIGARMDQPAVGLNIDNVPILNKDAYDFDIDDISKIEMLRGPQSTLYGRNTIGGVINISTLSPLYYTGLRAIAEYSSGNSWKAGAGYYARLREYMGISLNASFSSSDGFFKNEYNGKKLDHEKLLSLRSRFDWRPNVLFSLQNVVSFSRLRQGGYPYESLETGKISYNDPSFYHRTLFSDGLTLGFDFSGFSLTSVSSLQFIDDNMTLDQDFMPLEYFTLSQKKREVAVSQEVVARSRSDRQKYSWITGIFGFYKHCDMQAPVTFKDEGIANLIESNRNNANPLYPIRWDTRRFLLNSDFKLPTFGIALYHKSTLKFGRFDIQAALRVDYEHSGMRYHSYCNTGYRIMRIDPVNGQESDFAKVDINIDDKGHLSRHYLQFLPSLGIVYDLSNDYNKGNIYVNISKGFKSGGYNTQMFSDVLQQRLMNVMGIGSSYDIDAITGYKPEKSWNYEVGSHLYLLNGNLSLQASLFFIECTDQQLTAFPEGNTTGRIMTNAGKTHSFGGEVSVTGIVSGSFLLNASYGYTNAKFREYNNGIMSLKGKRIPYAPEQTLFIQAQYTWNTDCRWVDKIEFNANMRGAGKIYWNDENTLRQNFYVLPGAFIRLSNTKGSLELWGENLSDTKYSTFYFVSIGNHFVQRGKPFHMGVTVRINI